MAVNLNYRGNIRAKVANATVSWLKWKNKLRFVEWCPTGFQITLADKPKTFENDNICKFEKNAYLIANNIGIARFFQDRICKKYFKIAIFIFSKNIEPFL